MASTEEKSERKKRERKLKKNTRHSCSDLAGQKKEKKQTQNTSISKRFPKSVFSSPGLF